MLSGYEHKPHTYAQTHTERERERDIETHTERDTHRERERERTLSLDIVYLELHLSVGVSFDLRGQTSLTPISRKSSLLVIVKGQNLDGLTAPGLISR